MNRKHRAGILILLLAATISDAIPQAASHEEEVVRSTYATLSFLCSLEPVTKAAFAQMRQEYVGKKTLDQEVADATPAYELSDFHVGNVSEIAAVHWSEMFSIPKNGAVLTGSPVGDSYRWAGDGPLEDGWTSRWKEARVHWDDDPSYTSDRIEAMQGETVAGAIEAITKHGDWGPPAAYSNYATFTVNLTLKGRSTGPYRAAFLFGRDAEGKAAVVPLDAVGASGGLLWYVLHQNAYPGELLRSRLREQPIMERWIQANRLPMALCAAARSDLCCAEGRCALPDASVARDLAVALPGKP